MIDLQKGARAADKFHLTCRAISHTVWGYPWLLQRITWHGLLLPTGKPAHFTAWIAGWWLRGYWGTAKVDGTRTRMYWNGELGDKGNPTCFVANTWAEELWSVRFHKDALDLYRWDNMGGI